MFLDLRESLYRALKSSGYRVISPYKVPLGWIDLAITRRRSVGIEFYEGCYESCIERLTSHPFREIYVVGECNGCISLDDLCRKLGVEVELDIEEELENPTPFVKAIEDSLAYLYIAGEVYEDGITYRPLSVTLSELKMLGFATSSSKPKLKPKMFVSLTHEGYRAARKIIGRRVRRNASKLKKMASGLTYIMALGLSESLGIRELPEKPTDYSLKSLLSFMKSLPIEEFKVRGHPKQAFCQFMVNSVLNEKTVEIAKKLNKMGLAFKVKIHSPYGYETGEEYRIAREALEALLKYSYVSIPREHIGEFLASVYPFSNTDIHPILNHAARQLRTAEKAGVCRIDGSKITITEKFQDYARVRLAIAVEDVIGGLF